MVAPQDFVQTEKKVLLSSFDWKGDGMLATFIEAAAAEYSNKIGITTK